MKNKNSEDIQKIKVTKQIELLDGYVEETKEGTIVHSEIVFGRRPTMTDLFNVEANPQSGVPTQYNDLLTRVMITKFGKLSTPVSLNVMLALNKFDREDLSNAADEFMEMSRGSRSSDVLSDDTVRLPFGFEIEGVVYDVAQFGNILTGRDAAEADEYGDGVRRSCFEIGREIVELRASDAGNLKLAGPIAFEHFERLDVEDYAALKLAAQRWRHTFRLKRKELQRQRNGVGRVPADAGNEGSVGRGHSNDAA